MILKFDTQHTEDTGSTNKNISRVEFYEHSLVCYIRPTPFV